MADNEFHPHEELSEIDTDFRDSVFTWRFYQNFFLNT